MPENDFTIPESPEVRRERAARILAAVHERAEYRRIVANNWGDAAPIDVNATIRTETI